MYILAPYLYTKVWSEIHEYRSQIVSLQGVSTSKLLKGPMWPISTYSSTNVTYFKSFSGVEIKGKPNNNSSRYLLVF